VYARTIDFAAETPCDVIVVPRRYALMGAAPCGEPGMIWTSIYAAVGINTHGLPILLDGLNEKGLAVGALYHPGYATYQSVRAGDGARTLAPMDVPIWLLTRFASVDAAVTGLQDVVVGRTVFEPLGIVPPLHYVVHDTHGRCAVVEFIDGAVTIHDNAVGVVTNAPDFQWHLANLRHHLSRKAASGTLSIPGGFTPPARFVRAAAFTQTAAPVDTAEEAVQQAFHILGHCEIPRGRLRPRPDDGVGCNHTSCTSAVDIASGRLYFHTYGNRRVRMVDLMKMRLDASALAIFGMDTHEDVQELMAP